MARKQNAKRYEGAAYIGVVGPENENGECRDSIHGIVRRPGDSAPSFVRATKGYEARQIHLDRWYEQTKYEFILLLDHDMIFPADTLERLRSHGLPYVSGYYLRRRYAPLAPVWYEPGSGWPMTPWTREPERDRLHPLGASGWGCILMHREVFGAVKALLKGEPEVLEDDMDVWPYDLRAIVGALAGLRELVDTKPGTATLRPALEAHTTTLEKEIRPLRGDRDIVGSDIRFPFFARQAGYVLHGDPNVRCGHMLNYPLSPDDYSGQQPEAAAAFSADIKRRVNGEKRRVRQHLNSLMKGTA